MHRIVPRRSLTTRTHPPVPPSATALRRATARLALLTLATLACAPSRPSASLAAAEDPGAADVRAARLAQNAALQAGDVARAATWWTDSVTITAGLGRVLRGRDVYARAFSQDGALVYVRTPVTVRVSPHWPLAWEEGTWTGRRRDAADTTPAIGGHYAAQWVKAGGQWRIRSELFVAIECHAESCGWPVVAP